jgi:DNA-binding PadR family transcriptional regulator
MRSFQRSPLALAILTLLYEAPMHPYRVQQLIKKRDKDRVINIQHRTGIYQTIIQLQRAGLIEVRETSSEEKRPERTIYELTTKGHQTMLDWMREALAVPADEFPDFPAAISFLPVLSPDDALCQLEKRATALDAKLAQLAPLPSGREEAANQLSNIPRLFLLEQEILRVKLEAELKWVRSLISDLRTGKLTWSEAWLHQFIDPGN